MAREQDPHSRFARRMQYLPHFGDDAFSVLDLRYDANLHVIDEERHVCRIADFRERGPNF